MDGDQTERSVITDSVSESLPNTQPPKTCEKELLIVSESRNTQVGQGGSCRDPSLSTSLCGGRREHPAQSSEVGGRPSQRCGSERDVALKLFRVMCLSISSYAVRYLARNYGTAITTVVSNVWGRGGESTKRTLFDPMRSSAQTIWKFQHEVSFSLAKCFIGKKYELSQCPTPKHFPTVFEIFYFFSSHPF